MSESDRKNVLDYPIFTNPHIRMCAVITAIVRDFANGEEVLREAYRELGHNTGEYMISMGVVERGAGIEAYGRVSEQIMDACGLHDWTRLDAGPSKHATAVPRCANYCEAYQAIDAPSGLCAIPFSWDNGVLDIVNDTLQIWPGPCTYKDEGQCVYTIEPRTTRPGTSIDTTADVPNADATHIADAATWTNPQAGLYSIISHCVAHLGTPAKASITEALYQLGQLSGTYLLDNGLIPPNSSAVEAVTLAAEMFEVAGYTSQTVDKLENGAASVTRHEHPFIAVFEHFNAPSDLQEVVAAWDRGWLSRTNPNLEMVITHDTWRGSQSDRFVIRPVAADSEG